MTKYPTLKEADAFVWPANSSMTNTENLVDVVCAGTAEKLLSDALEDNARLRKALQYCANSDNWEYTDSCMQFSKHATIKDDVWTNPDVGEEGGADYAGRRAKEALSGSKLRQGSLW